jgi:hypothetical protein
MALRCRPGDLAVVVEGGCVGLFVTVVAPGPPHPIARVASWQCRVSAPCPVTCVTLEGAVVVRETTLPAGSMVLFCDRELQPIRPPCPPIAIPAPELETT